MNDTSSPRAGGLTARKRAVFLVVTLVLPLVLLGMLEAALRIGYRPAGYPLFVAAPFTRDPHLIANAAVGSRWFSGLDAPPGPMQEPFASVRTSGTIRLFVLGESAAAGFPYPRNGTFSRLLRDALRSALPGDSIEVVNLGIAATNSYAIWDMAAGVAEQEPAAVLIYAGHNEYYGALGAGSAAGVAGARPGLTRLYLRSLRLRTVWLLRNAVASMPWRASPPGGDDQASLMELLAREQQIALGSSTYRAGLEQFEGNLARVIRAFRSRGIPVFVASVPSNIADLAPFAAAANDQPGGARAVYDSARSALARGDSSRARFLFERARDLDVVRFRAPSALNALIRKIASAEGARYVPVAEAFAARSPAGAPGANLFLEHVHPNRTGYALIARSFFEQLATAPIPAALAGAPSPDWNALELQVPLTAFDERIAFHTVRTLTQRWPFVPLSAQRDYRAQFRPDGFLDSLAFLVSRGTSWAVAKAELARLYEQRGMSDSAAAEYRGLVADAPFFQEPRILLAGALERSGNVDEAERELRAALALGESPRVLAALGGIALRRGRDSEAVALLLRASRMEPANPDLLFQLLLAYGRMRDAAGARSTAQRIARIAPGYPGLAEWMAALGLSGGR